MKLFFNHTETLFLYQWINGCLSKEELYSFETSETYRSLVRSQSKAINNGN